MPDDSELDYLITFLDEATTSVTVKSFETIRKLPLIAGTKKILIEPGELLSTDGPFYKKRYKIKIGLENEANMMSIINEIINGTLNYNKRKAGFTYPTVMCNITFVYSNKGWVTTEGRWEYDVFLDVEWSTS